MAEPKFNGSCAETYIDRTFKVMNRHNALLSGVRIQEDEFRHILDFGRENLIVGEYMNKAKKDRDGNLFNHKFVVFDIIVLEGIHLLGKTFEERYQLLMDRFNPINEDDISYKLSDNIYFVKRFLSNFGEIWDNITPIDMIEGLVFKKLKAGLEVGIREKNNNLTQLKCRKEVKNYSY